MILVSLNSFSNAAQNDISKDIDDTKRFPAGFSNELGRCTHAEVKPTLKSFAIPVLRPKRPEQQWSWIHVDFAGPINSLSLFGNGRLPFQMA